MNKRFLLNPETNLPKIRLVVLELNAKKALKNDNRLKVSFRLSETMVVQHRAKFLKNVFLFISAHIRCHLTEPTYLDFCFMLKISRFAVFETVTWKFRRPKCQFS